MNKVALFDAKSYDIEFFDKFKSRYGIEIDYFESKLGVDTAILAGGYDAVVIFVNDNARSATLDKLSAHGVKAIALRSAGFNNVNIRHARDLGMKVFRVPAYSPNAVAEHAMALLLCLNRKIHRAYSRVREYNFSLKGFVGFDLKGKTMGVIGTGKIGQEFIKISQGFGMDVIAHDPYPVDLEGVRYVGLEELFRKSDIIALHCPLTKDNQHLINMYSIKLMKEGVYIINTSRGALIDADALLEGIKIGKIRGAGLDVYEEEADVFFEDMSDTVITDDTLKLLLATQSVVITSHQAFLTDEALQNIAETTLENLRNFFDGTESPNEIIYEKIKK